MAENQKKRALTRRRTPKSVRAQAKPALQTNTVTSNPLKLLVTIINRSKTEFYADLIQSFDVNLQAIVLAEGTADANMLRYLGLTDTAKSVILSVVQSDRLADALAALEDKFRTVRDGKGIAFTVPLTSVIGKLLFGFLSNNRSVVKEER